MTGTERVPGIQLTGHAQVHKPVILQGFPEIARRMRRDAPTHPGNLLQLGFALRIPFTRRLAKCFFGVPFRKPDQCGCTDRHCPEFLFLIICLRVIQRIQFFQTKLNILLEIQHTLVINLVVQDGVTGGALLHKFGKDAGVVGGLPFLRHLAEKQVAHGFAMPEWKDGLLINFPGGRADTKGGFLARIKDIQVLQTVAA